jgi:hypothetical protein
MNRCAVFPSRAILMPTLLVTIGLFEKGGRGLGNEGVLFQIGPLTRIRMSLGVIGFDENMDRLLGMQILERPKEHGVRLVD